MWPDFIGISIKMTKMEQAKRIAENIRNILSDVPAVFESH